MTYFTYQSNLHVPLIFRHSSLAATRRIVEPVQLVDIAPTLMDLAGLPVPSELEGTSLAPELRGEGKVTHPTYTVAHTDRSYASKASIVEGDLEPIVDRDTETLDETKEDEIVLVLELVRRGKETVEIRDPVPERTIQAIETMGDMMLERSVFEDDATSASQMETIDEGLQALAVRLREQLGSEAVAPPE
jgi:hypothetical protein